MKLNRPLVPSLLLLLSGLFPVEDSPLPDATSGKSTSTSPSLSNIQRSHSSALSATPDSPAPGAPRCAPGPEKAASVTSTSSAANAPRHPKGAPVSIGPDGDSGMRPLTDLFVLVSVDGLRPDVIFPHAPTIQRLRHAGADARNTRTISKSTTLPSHASMVSGVDHDQHGLSFNSYHPERGPIRFPTIFSEAEKAGLSVKLFAGKRKLELLVASDQRHQFQLGGVYCNRVTELAVPYLHQAEPGVVFVHFADPDGAGHTHGWLSEEYMRAVHRADRCVGQLLQAITSRTDGMRVTMLITSDHGGHDHGHGTRRADDRRIPWVLWGEAANPRTRVRRAVLNTDTAATVLHALGLPAPAQMLGTPVFEALTDDEV